jgi:hypothetical protein
VGLRGAAVVVGRGGVAVVRRVCIEERKVCVFVLKRRGIEDKEDLS